MVKSTAATVDAYIAEADPARVPHLTRLRDLVRAHLPDHDEAILYGMPTWSRNGAPDFAFASQKGHLALYIMRTDVTAANAEALAALDCGKGCIRFRKPDAIDYALVAKLLDDTRSSASPPC